MSRRLVVDLFAGGGGASTGIEAALGRPVDVAINHDAVALAVHNANHPATWHLKTDIWEVHPQEATGGLPVDLLWASPDCTHFSVAKGGRPRKQKIRSLAWVVVRWAASVRPRLIMLENVAEFRGWGPLDAYDRPVRAREGDTFRRWRRKLEALGYIVDYRVLDASHYGVPTKRKRLFLVARCDGQPIRWPKPTHGTPARPLRTAAECIDWTLPIPSIFERQKPLAAATLRRIAYGIRRYVIETPNPYIVDLGDGLVSPTLITRSYGERPGQLPRVPGLHKPLGTLVAQGEKHALVAAFLSKHYTGVVGHDLHRPIGAVTAKDHHSLSAATLVKLRGECNGSDIQKPVPTLTAGGTHVGLVRAFLTTYYSGGSKGQTLNAPMRTVTTKARLGLVTVAGEDYEISDIGMRMLQPHELLRAQFGKFADSYTLAGAPNKTDKIRLIGNSVCPEVAEALVACNMPRQTARPLEEVA